MLPIRRTEEHQFDVPKFDLTIADIENLPGELDSFNEEFQKVFRRPEPRQCLRYYMSGLLSGLERKFIEPMAEHINGARVRTQQRFVSDTAWDDDFLLPFKYVLADSVYGENPGFLSAVESLAGIIYFVQVRRDTAIQLKRPVAVPQGKQTARAARGKAKQGGRSAAERNRMSAEEFALGLRSFFWYRRKVSEGAKGPITYEFAKRRVFLVHPGGGYREVWLVARRSLGADPEYAYYISNAPDYAQLPLFVWLSGLRWAIEQCFGENKTELGMDHYEVRKYWGWDHHMRVCMLTHFFLIHLAIRLEKKITQRYSVPDPYTVTAFP